MNLHINQNGVVPEAEGIVLHPRPLNDRPASTHDIASDDIAVFPSSHYYMNPEKQWILMEKLERYDQTTFCSYFAEFT